MSDVAASLRTCAVHGLDDGPATCVSDSRAGRSLEEGAGGSVSRLRPEKCALREPETSRDARRPPWAPSGLRSGRRLSEAHKSNRPLVGPCQRQNSKTYSASFRFFKGFPSGRDCSESSYLGRIVMINCIYYDIVA